MDRPPDENPPDPFIVYWVKKPACHRFPSRRSTLPEKSVISTAPPNPAPLLTRRTTLPVIDVFAPLQPRVPPADQDHPLDRGIVDDRKPGVTSEYSGPPKTEKFTLWLSCQLS